MALQILLRAQCGQISTTVNSYILYSVKLRTESTILTVNQVAMCYLALPFTSQYFIQTPIAMISKKEHACDVHGMEVARILRISEFENLKLLLLVTQVLNGNQCNHKMHVAVKAMYARHTVCSTLREGNKQPPLLHTSSIKQLVASVKLCEQ